LIKSSIFSITVIKPPRAPFSPKNNDRKNEQTLVFLGGVPKNEAVYISESQMPNFHGFMRSFKIGPHWFDLSRVSKESKNINIFSKSKYFNNYIYFTDEFTQSFEVDGVCLYNFILFFNKVSNYLFRKLV